MADDKSGASRKRLLGSIRIRHQAMDAAEPPGHFARLLFETGMDMPQIFRRDELLARQRRLDGTWERQEFNLVAISLAREDVRRVFPRLDVGIIDDDPRLCPQNPLHEGAEATAVVLLQLSWIKSVFTPDKKKGVRRNDERFMSVAGSPRAFSGAGDAAQNGDAHTRGTVPGNRLKRKPKTGEPTNNAAQRFRFDRYAKNRLLFRSFLGLPRGSCFAFLAARV